VYLQAKQGSATTWVMIESSPGDGSAVGRRGDCAEW